MYKPFQMHKPWEFVKVIDPYLVRRYFRAKLDGAGVPQDSDLSTMLHNLYASDTALNTEIAVYVDAI